MNTVGCAHCGGKGEELASISLQTGERKYRTCGVCKGAGKVSAERSHFTEYPDRSLELARELMRRNGSPAEICIAGNHDVRVLFKDGSRYVLGGFTVGYRGTGPDYTKAFLDAAGFNISIDSVADMSPPVTLLAGHPYIAPKTLVLEASTVEEAKKAAREALPSDAKVIELDVVHDGNSETAEGVGSSEDAALQSAKSHLPKEAIVVEQNVSDSASKTAEGAGNSESTALEATKRHLPAGAIVKETRVVQRGSEGRLTMPAFSEEEARKSAQPQLPIGATIQAIACIRPMSKGFLGFGRKPGNYEVHWVVPFKIALTYCLKKAVLIYRRPAAVRVRFQPASNHDIEAIPEPNPNEEVLIEDGLMWQKKCDGLERTQEEAFEYCRGLLLAGYSDWHLPSLAEFRSLGRNLEPNFHDYWTSSDEPRLSPKVAYIDDGTTMFRTNKYFVRAVRNT